MGPDGVSYGMLKNLHPSSRELMLGLLNDVWSLRSLPCIWHHAFAFPLLKPGKVATDPDSYRFIALTCNLCKVLERLVVRRLNYWLEDNGKLDDAQNGFRKSRSVTDNVVILHRVVSEALT